MRVDEYDDLEFALRDGIARVWIARPERKNALGDRTTRHLIEVLAAIEADPEAKVVILAGKGGDFSAGGDFKDTFARGEERSAPQWAERIRQGPNRLAEQLRSLSKPVVAAIDGVAVGGGATIALACDLRIASESARFAFPFSKIGLTPEFGCSYLLPRVVGLGASLELLLLGDFIDAREAHRLGLVHRVVPRERLDDEAEALAARLAQRPPAALRAIKQLLYHAMSSDMASALEREALALGDAFVSPDHRQAVQAFLSRERGPAGK
ncbi:enoyl-CoA hydratase-related protein [Castellaniella sp. GW247-6E4]|uniref:enoyl-CoA hydratase/isomerase family protein n=1 Tax=Castellaniella sp. GW247-6E4 TaxID=3140380 RepID=UPI003315DFD6